MTKTYYEENFGWIIEELKKRIKESSALGINGLAKIEDLKREFLSNEIDQLIRDGEIYEPRPGFVKFADVIDNENQ